MKVAIGPSSFAAADKTPLNLLEEAGCTVVPNPYGRRLTEEEIIEHLDGIDGLIAGLEPLNARVLESAQQLKALARVGIGVANVDFDAAERCNIKVSSTPDEPTKAVTELTIAALLYFARQLQPMNAALHAGEWKKMISPGVYKSKVLVVGFGRIGRAVAEVLNALGADILVADPYLEPSALPDGAKLVSLEEGLSEADFITLHAAGEDVIIKDAEFTRMKDGAVLLNSARGGLVDEQALFEALKSGKIAGAWFDAFWQEPYSGTLTQFENFLMTPHCATYTSVCRREMESHAVRNLLRDLGLS